MTEDGAVRAYIDGAAARMRADGCEVSAEQWGGDAVTIGYRSDFRVRWMGTRLHLFTVLMAMPVVSAGGVERFTDAVFTYALARKGRLRGMQSGVAVFPALVSTHVDPRALAAAREGQRVRFACLARPVVVDAGTGEVGCFRGTAKLGIIYSAHLRAKLAAYFPE